MTTLALTNLSLADSWNMHGGWGWAWMVPTMLGMVLWGAIIFGVFWLIREGVQRRQPAPEETALTILDSRFAEGALSHKDYRQRRNVLSGAAPPRTDEDIRAERKELAMKRLVIGTAVAGGAAVVFRRLVVVMVVGPVVAAAAVAGVVVLAALTSWWVLFALFALPPLMMMVCGPVMMTAMRGPAGSGFPAAGSCPPWRRSDLDRATWSG